MSLGTSRKFCQLKCITIIDGWSLWLCGYLVKHIKLPNFGANVFMVQPHAQPHTKFNFIFRYSEHKETVNSLESDGPSIWTRWQLVHAIVWCLLGAKPLPKPMLIWCQLNIQDQILITLDLKHKELFNMCITNDVCKMADILFSPKLLY